MTSRRSLENRVSGLEEADGPDGFYYYKVGGEPEPERTGYYEWYDDRGEYVNEHGHTISADTAPDSEFDYIIELAGDEEADR